MKIWRQNIPFTLSHYSSTEWTLLWLHENVYILRGKGNWHWRFVYWYASLHMFPFKNKRDIQIVNYSWSHPDLLNFYVSFFQISYVWEGFVRWRKDFRRKNILNLIYWKWHLHKQANRRHASQRIIYTWATPWENVFGSLDQARHKPACAATEASYSLEILVIESRDIILSKQQTTKALIRLRWCAGWSAPLLFAYDTRHIFSWPGSHVHVWMHM